MTSKAQTAVPKPGSAAGAKRGGKPKAKAVPSKAAREAAHQWCDAFNGKLAELLESAELTLAEVRDPRHPMAAHIQETALEELVFSLNGAIGLAALTPPTADEPAALPSAGALLRKKAGRAKG